MQPPQTIAHATTVIHAGPRWYVGPLPLADALTLLLVFGTWLLALVTWLLSRDTRDGNRRMLELQRKEISARLCLNLLPRIEEQDFINARIGYFRAKKGGSLATTTGTSFYRYYLLLDHMSALIRGGVVLREDVSCLLYENPWEIWPTIAPMVETYRTSIEGPRYLENIEWVAKNP